jgi:hypothetical protein
MTQQDYELLSQYLDGELSGPAAAALEQRLAVDIQLGEGLEQLRRQDERLKKAFNSPDIETVPAGIMALLEQDARPRIVPPPHRRTAGWGFALAASLVIAASAVLLAQWNTGGSRQGSATVDTALTQVLEQSPSRGSGWEALADGRRARPVLSFESMDGTWCREYLVSGDSTGGYAHGVACRRNGAWVTEVVAPAPAPGAEGEYRPAGSTDSLEVSDFIAAHAAGIALDRQQEAELINREWRQR